ncbi:hypothetical protein IJ670_03875 [bacterium]|nr:hypothetical protein [bacterium]
MKLNNFAINFKGYDSAPLKNIHLEKNSSSEFLEEMQEIGKKEGFGVKLFEDYSTWSQDDKTFVEINNRPKIAANENVSPYFWNYAKKENVEISKERGFLTGGDTFIGKYPTGEKWLITGHSPILPDFRQDISNCYGIKQENIFSVPRPNFHLDMALRPIGYPNILVNDFNLVDKNIKKLDDDSVAFKNYLSSYEYFKAQTLSKYSDTNRLYRALKKLGFNPIRVAGIYGNEVNFMNGIINKHKDNTFSYITNSSESSTSPFYTKMQEMFKKELSKKVPDLSQIYFVKGKNATSGHFCGNFIMETLKYQHGGIHCMSLEEPNFEIWA